MTRILVADDHPFILSGLEAVLRHTAFEVVATATTGAAALEAVRTARPDILVLDVQMPEGSGLDVLRALRAGGDDRPVVLLTAHLGDERLLEALELGVQGIVLKEGAQHLLLQCLDRVRAGERWIDGSLLQRALDLKISGRAGRADALETITRRERAIAELVSRGLRNRAIAEELGITEGTVKVYLHNIYEKLGIANRTELAVRVRQAREATPSARPRPGGS